MNDTHNVTTVRPSATSPLLLVDSYAHGISIGAGERQAGCELGMEGEGGASVRLRSRYVLRTANPLADLERHLQRLAARGELRRATVVFGVTTDPFHPFDEKFPTSMKFLEMFERYGPGRLVIQTRSPLVTIGIPVLKKLQRNTFVAIGIETPLDDVRRLYTPSLPSVEERFKTVRALKRFGLQVGVQVAPILPYGDWRKDAGAFAEKLSEVADFINIRSLAQAGDAGSGRGESTPLAKKLAAARQFFWLRRDTHVPLTGAVEAICPEKLFNPVLHGVVDPQLRLFAQQ